MRQTSFICSESSGRTKEGAGFGSRGMTKQPCGRKPQSGEYRLSASEHAEPYQLHLRLIFFMAVSSKHTKNPICVYVKAHISRGFAARDKNARFKENP